MDLLIFKEVDGTGAIEILLECFPGEAHISRATQSVAKEFLDVF